MSALGFALDQDVLVAGVGNLFRGDDGFGSAVVHALVRRDLPPGMRVVDFGTRGFDLAIAILEARAAILVDAVERGSPPGTLHALELDPDRDHLSGALPEGHALAPAEVLGLVRALGGPHGRLLLVGCQPEVLGDDDELVVGLSPPVARAVEPAADLVLTLIRELAPERSVAGEARNA